MDRPPTNGYDKDHHPSRVNPGRQPHTTPGIGCAHVVWGFAAAGNFDDASRPRSRHPAVEQFSSLIPSPRRQRRANELVGESAGACESTHSHSSPIPATLGSARRTAVSHDGARSMPQGRQTTRGPRSGSWAGGPRSAAVRRWGGKHATNAEARGPRVGASPPAPATRQSGGCGSGTRLRWRLYAARPLRSPRPG